ncbi:hypothetical protein ADUPG1_005026, partial [Aduncisulcus paluster]
TYQAGVPEEGTDTENEDGFIPVADFDNAKVRTGELGKHTFNQLLVPVVGRGEVKGGFSQLDSQSITEDYEHERQLHKQRLFVSQDLINPEASGYHEDGCENEDKERFVGQDLNQFALRTNLTVRGRSGKPTHNQEYSSDCLNKEDQEQVASGKEQSDGQGCCNEVNP